nr:hypothetical protein [Solemoviridae sp.]
MDAVLPVVFFAVAGGLLVVAIRRFCKWSEQRTLKYLPESMKDGSALVTVALSSFPFVVGIYSVKIRNPDKKEFKGTGTIIDGYIVTANHVIDSVKPALSSEQPTHQLYARMFDGTFHLLGDWIQIHTDAIYFKAPPGYKSARVETLQRPQHAQVVAAREQSNSSMGILQNKPEIAFGFVQYDGSTLHGFSGAPYTNGQKVMGIHIQGGSAGNFGYSASFLVSKMRRISRPESSEWEAFERALSQASQDEVSWDRGLDETEIRVGGRYFLFDNEEFDTYIEESEFMDWFYEDQEDQKGHKQKRFKKGRKHKYQLDPTYEEPDYEGAQRKEGAEPGDKSFLEVTPPPVSSGEDLKKATDSLNTAMLRIQSLETLLQQALVGLKERDESLKEAFICIQKLVHESHETQCHQLETRLTGLESNLTRLITSGSKDHQSSMSPSGISASEQSSEPSTPPAVQASEYSQNMGPLAKRWDGMDSDFEKFKTWRCSVNVLDPEYASWRDMYLSELGLDPTQSKILIGRMKNYLKKLNHRRERRVLQGTQRME